MFVLLLLRSYIYVSLISIYNLHAAFVCYLNIFWFLSDLQQLYL